MLHDSGDTDDKLDVLPEVGSFSTPWSTTSLPPISFLNLLWFVKIVSEFTELGID